MSLVPEISNIHNWEKQSKATEQSPSLLAEPFVIHHIIRLTDQIALLEAVGS
jgi:hypothetical protein